MPKKFAIKKINIRQHLSCLDLKGDGQTRKISFKISYRHVIKLFSVV